MEPWRAPIDRAASISYVGLMKRNIGREALKGVVWGSIRHLPWHLRRTAPFAIMNWGGRKPPFEGVYTSFCQVPASIPGNDQADSAMLRRHSLQRDDSPLHLVRLGRGQQLSMVVAALARAEDGPFRILDFGGGGGADFATLIASLGDHANISYTVIELPAVCRAAQNFWAGEKRIRYLETLPENETFDLCYTWGGIQYQEDIYGLIRSMGQMSKHSVLFAGSPFSDQDFVRAQVNQSAAYPQWVISLPKTKAIMTELGFTLQLAAAGEEEYNVDNYAPEYRVPGSATLLFRRRQPPVSVASAT